MWVEVKRVPNRIMAEMWRDLLEGEGIPTRIIPERRDGGEFSPYRVYVPRFREHVVEEVLRKL